MRRPVAPVAIAVLAVVAIAARQRSVRIPGPPTFSREVVRIFQANCQSCHHPGDIAPFSLMTYDDARPWAQRIKLMTSTHQMPPWKPEAECASLKGERRISDSDIATIAQWVDSGAPEGDRRDLPAPLQFGDWSAGQPDLVFSMPQKYDVATGADIYRCFSIPTNLTADAAVAAIDTRPGNRALVHHVIAFIDDSGQSQALDDADPAPGYGCFGGPGFPPSDALGGWAPGARPAFLPDGIATKLPKDSRIVLQVHYHPHEEGGSDQTQIGVYLSKTPVQHWLHYLPLMNDTFVIPAGASNYPVEASESVPFFVAAKLWNITPHMHLLGRTMRVTATYPDGREECLIDIRDWDFNWQGTYTFAQPIDLPGSTRVNLRATFDNSASNSRNPNAPPKDVRWGEQTTDEMCIAFLGVTTDIAGASTDPAEQWWDGRRTTSSSKSTSSGRALVVQPGALHH